MHQRQFSRMSSSAECNLMPAMPFGCVVEPITSTSPQFQKISILACLNRWLQRMRAARSSLRQCTSSHSLPGSTDSASMDYGDLLRRAEAERKPPATRLRIHNNLGQKSGDSPTSVSTAKKPAECDIWARSMLFHSTASVVIEGKNLLLRDTCHNCMAR